MKRSKWILLAVCACSLLAMACKNTAEVKRRIPEMQQHDICLPLSEFMLCTTDDEKANTLLFLPVAYVLSAVLYLGGRAFVADQFIITTWSMAPTRVPGNRVVVNKFIMGARLYTDLDFHDGGQGNNYSGTLGLQAEQNRLESVPDDAYDAAGMAVFPFDERVGWTFKHMGPLYIPREDDQMQFGTKEPPHGTMIAVYIFPSWHQITYKNHLPYRIIL